MRSRSEAVAEQATKAPVSPPHVAPMEVEQRTVTTFHDPINEQIVIAAMVADLSLCDKLQVDHFLVSQHHPIVSALKEMRRKRLAFDAATLGMLGLPADAVEYVAALADARPTVPENLAYHLDVLAWDKTRHTAATGPVPALNDALRDPKSDPELVRALARRVPEVFSTYQRTSYVHDSSVLASEQTNEIRKRMQGGGHFPIGIKAIDYFEEAVPGEVPEPRLIPGAARGQFILVVGLSGSGKSTLCSNIALGLREQKRRGFVGAWEQTGGTSLELMATIALGLNRKDVKLGRITEEQLQMLEAKMQEIGRDIVFQSNPWQARRKAVKFDRNDPNGANIEFLQASLAESGADWAILDILRRMFRRFDADDEEGALVTLQAMFQHMRMTAICTHQLRKDEVATRADKRPTRDSIKGTAAWTEVPDLILGTNRPAFWKSSIPDTKMEVVILKQRDGVAPLAVEIEWDPARGSLGAGKSIPFDVEPTDEANPIDKVMKRPGAPVSGKFSRGRYVRG